MRLVFAAAALIALSAPIAQAQLGGVAVAGAPKKIGDFVPYCTGNFKDCRTMVIVVDIELLAEGKASICTIGIKDTAVAAKSIVAWLAQHKETHGMPTKAGIRAAIKALWPC